VGRTEYLVDTDVMRLDLFPAPGGAPAQPFTGIWDGKSWVQGTSADALSRAYLDGAAREPFGILYTMAYRDVGPGMRLVGMIRGQASTISRDKDLLKIEVPGSETTPFGAGYTFWLSPANGTLPVRWERKNSTGTVELRVENRLEEVQPGLWAPTRIVARWLVADSTSPLKGKVMIESEQEVDLKSSRFGSLPQSIVADAMRPAGFASPGSGWGLNLALMVLLTLALLLTTSLGFAWHWTRQRPRQVQTRTKRLS
jgi:hypothetical protein